MDRYAIVRDGQIVAIVVGHIADPEAPAVPPDLADVSPDEMTLKDGAVVRKPQKAKGVKNAS